MNLVSCDSKIFYNRPSSDNFYIYAESRSDYRDLVCIQAKMVWQGGEQEGIREGDDDKA